MMSTGFQMLRRDPGFSIGVLLAMPVANDYTIGWMDWPIERLGAFKVDTLGSQEPESTLADL
jgi:hypothetical protein